MIIRATLLLLLIASLLIDSGCRKNANIWGTWQETSVRQTNVTAGDTTYNNTTYLTSGGAAFTFTVGGAYYSTYSAGQYTKAGNTLTLTDTASGAPHSVGFNVLALTDQLLVLQTTDTISLSPLSTVQFIYTLSPA
jgi:hypothetical protein